MLLSRRLCVYTKNCTYCQRERERRIDLGGHYSQWAKVLIIKPERDRETREITRLPEPTTKLRWCIHRKDREPDRERETIKMKSHLWYVKLLLRHPTERKFRNLQGSSGPFKVYEHYGLIFTARVDSSIR